MRFPRTVTFVGLVIGVAIYQGTKLIFGFTPHWDDLFDATWWAGAALFTNWLQQRHSSARGAA